MEVPPSRQCPCHKGRQSTRVPENFKENGPSSSRIGAAASKRNLAWTSIRTAWTNNAHGNAGSARSTHSHENNGFAVECKRAMFQVGMREWEHFCV